RALENEFIERVQRAVEAAGLWDEFDTDWICLDCELMPWSAKAQELVRQQYAAVGSAARAALAEVVDALESTGNAEVDALRERYRQRAQAAEQYVAAYRRYCWPVKSL